MRINLIFKRLVKADDQENNNIKNTMELYEELMENSGDFLFSVTESGRLLFSNQHFKDSLRLSDEQAEAVNFNSILHYLSGKAFRKLFEIVSDHENIVLHITSRLGEEVIIQGNCTTYKKDEELVLRGLFHNVTSEFKKNQELKRSEVKFKMLFEKSMNPIFYYDSKGIIDCNEAFIEILGFEDKEDLLGRLPSDFSAESQPGIDNPEKAAWKIDNLTLQNGGHQFE
ncbi:MAG: PAS domain-containing protein [Flavobacteriales bacterium]|nr:PAS domain-containing protein [Flavobacteriales bacterium]